MPIEKYTPGRNLLRKSATFVSGDIVLTRSTVPETGTLRLTPTTGASAAKFKCDYLVLGDYSGKTFTLSLDAREIAEGTYASAIGKAINPRIIVSTAARYATAYATSYDKIFDEPCTPDASDVGEWNRYSITGTIPDDLNAGSGVPDNTWVISVMVQRAAKTSPIEVKNIKLELGSVATAWSPAPEDMYPGYSYQIIARNELTVAWNNDIASYTRYYLLQSSTLSPPSVPSTNPPPSPTWGTTEPNYTYGSTDSLYFVDLTVFADGTWTYSAVSLSSSYEAAKQAFNEAVAAGNTASAAHEIAETALDQSVEYIVGTQDSATGSWTGVTKDTILKTGKTIAYKLPYDGSGNASLTLTLNNGEDDPAQTTAAIPVYINATRVTNHYPAQTVIRMTYDGTAWRTDNYNSNTNYYDRRNHANSVKAAAAVTAKHLIAGTGAGYKMLAADLEFDLSYPILYASAKITVATPVTSTYEAFPSVDFSITGTIEEGTAYYMLYLKGTVTGNTFKIAADNWLTTVIPSADDGYYYIPLGVLGDSTTLGYFASSNRLFAYINGAFQAVDTAAQITASDAQTAADNAQTAADNAQAAADDARLEAQTARENLDTLVASVASRFEAVQADYRRMLESFRDELSQYIEFSETLGLILGAVDSQGQQSDFKTVIDNESMKFMQGDNIVAWISNRQLYINNAIIDSALMIGHYFFSERPDGGISLTWQA